MASADNEVPAPIIIKKVKKYAAGHHGGAWKVAYADFVTAMMAFFLLMWLLNMTTKEQKNAISDYFDPSHPKVSSTESGSGGILGGLTMAPDGAMSSTVSPIAPPPVNPNPQTGSALGKQRDRTGTSDYEGGVLEASLENSDASEESQSDVLKTESSPPSENEINVLNEIDVLRDSLEEEQNEIFEGIKQKIYEEIEKSPELADLKEQLLIDITPEGLRIQIIDKEGRSMFPSAKANMLDFMRHLLEKVTQVIIQQPNQVSVRGHTDSSPYPKGATYNNWNLSSDRALATRTVMVQGGLTQQRIENVVGRADREHLFPKEPLSPRNRRISIVLLREKLETDDAVREAAKKSAVKADNIKTKSDSPTINDLDNEDVPSDTPLSDHIPEDPAPYAEDRTDAPELDQTIDGPVPFTIQHGGVPSHATDDEISEAEKTIHRNQENIVLEKIEAEHKEIKTHFDLPSTGVEDSEENEPQFLQFP